MPLRRRGNIGRATRNASGTQRIRNQLTPEQQSQRRENERESSAVRRQAETNEHRMQRLATMRITRLTSRNRASDLNRTLSQLGNRSRMQIERAKSLSSFHRIAFEYSPETEYCANPKINIGSMDKECVHCHALKFKNEPPGMCCSSGKVVLPSLNPPPDPLKNLMDGNTAESKLFLKKIRKFNNCFQMTSFAANIISNTDGLGRTFNSTFKIQGQVYHKIGSLLPVSTEKPKFLQIYFMGDVEEQANIRCGYNQIQAMQERAIVSELESFLADKNYLIQLFKQFSSQLHNDNYMIVIKPDKVPNGEHARRFNTPTVNEVGIVMVGDSFEHRDIRIMRRNNTTHIIADTHRSYDALQYPLIFWEGEDGYHINIKQRNPQTGEYNNYNT